MTERHASCTCGQLRVKTSGEPIRVSICHCFACQQRTGSAFGYQARFPRGQVRVFGESTSYTRVADSGNRITFNFCPRCGATVHYHLEHIPDVLAIPVGAFADASFPAPQFSVYEARRHRWFDLHEPMEHHE